MASPLDAADAFLIAQGADSVAHPGGTLLEHLRRVRIILRAWEASTDVQLAGLCHAAYGTDGFAKGLIEVTQRAVLTEIIGARAEALVYLYGSCDRAFVYPKLHLSTVSFRDRFTGDMFAPDLETLRAFVEITAANELDVVRNDADIASAHGHGLAALFEGGRGHLSQRAQQAWKTSRGDGSSPI